MKCDTCRFWHIDEGVQRDVGECRRRSPLPVIQSGESIDAGEFGDAGRAHWPHTMSDDWCGEYQPPALKQG